MTLSGGREAIGHILKVRGTESLVSHWLKFGRESQRTDCSQVLSSLLSHHKEFGIYLQSSIESPKAVTESNV